MSSVRAHWIELATEEIKTKLVAAIIVLWIQNYIQTSI